MSRDYESIVLGDGIETEARTIPTEDVIKFCNGWENPDKERFTDKEAALLRGLPGAIVPGPMSMLYMAQFLTKWADGGCLKKLDVVFRQIVLHDSPIYISGIITDKNDDLETLSVDCDVFIKNEVGDILVGGKAIISLQS